MAVHTSPAQPHLESRQDLPLAAGATSTVDRRAEGLKTGEADLQVATKRLPDYSR